MESKWKLFLANWAITTLGVVVAANVVPSITYDHNTTTLLVASLLLGVFYAVLRPILMILTLPLMILSLGLFTFVINAALLYLVGRTVQNFLVPDFKSAFWGGLVISLVGGFSRSALGIKTNNPRVRINVNASASAKARPPSEPPKKDRIDSGSGPVIDV